MPIPTIFQGDCLEVMRLLPDSSVSAIVTDPPYGLGFMGKAWDDLPPGLPWAQECLRVLKPGGHLLAFGGTRTWHRLACAIEDAGFEMRDSIAWLYGSGFPKSLDVSKAIDKAARGVPQGGTDPTSPNHGNYRTTITEGKRWHGDSGQGYGAGGSRFLADGQASDSATGPAASGPAETVAEALQWQGWGTALKPAFEPVVVARKPLVGTVAQNVLAYGAGALNIDATRIGMSDTDRERLTEWHGKYGGKNYAESGLAHGKGVGDIQPPHSAGRWPANVVLDEDQAAALDQQSGTLTSGANPKRRGADGDRAAYGDFAGQEDADPKRGIDKGGASRFFYVAKAPKSERPVVDGVAHPTVKPLALMRWLVRMFTPPGGLLLDPFAGSGTTVEAALLEGFDVVGIERDETYLPLIQARIDRQQAKAETPEDAS